MQPSAGDPATSDPAPTASRGAPATGRLSPFLAIALGFVLLLAAYFTTIRLLESALDREMQTRVDRAIAITELDRPLTQQIQERIDRAVRDSLWVRWGGLRVTTLVLARDGVTWLYVDGRGAAASPEGLSPFDTMTEWMDYLPATAEVTVTLPYGALLSNAVLVVYAGLLLLFIYATSRRQSGVEAERLREALAVRDHAARRAEEIESELASTRMRLSQIEPIERELSEEISGLQQEREALQQKLASLAAREESLRSRAEHAVGLAQEVRALEDLLEEASSDLDSKDSEIGRLEQSLKKASKSSDRAANAKSRAADVIARRFRTLYKTIEVDDRAIDDIASLGDESLRLKAEEAVKRLAEEADNVSVRRKVGGLPGYVQVFELGFAGKGRIYYMRGKSRRFRILLVGAKNTQSADLEYLSGLPKSDFT
jgi:DNA repair exonuclease SbcCD ATPase subunit